MLVVVLGLLAFVLCITYAMSRTQQNAATIGDNGSRASAAQQAAVAGLSLAMKRMHEANWTIATTLAGSFDSRTTYTAAYAIGDPRLSAGHAEFAQYPYRVTISAIGRVSDPLTSVVTERTASAIVELAPRRRPAPPAAWNTAQNFTLVQWQNKTAELHPPMQIDGPVLLQGAARLGRDYPTSDSSRKTYFTDLNGIRTAGGSDHRPVTGPVHAPSTAWLSDQRSRVADDLGVSVVNIAQNNTALVTQPGAVTSYRLFTGGPEYSVPQLVSPIENQSLAPDPLTNPLGVFRHSGTLRLANSASVEGVLLLSGGGSELRIEGNQVTLQRVAIPTVPGESGQVELPVAVVQNKLLVAAGAVATVRGVAVVGNDTTIEQLGNSAALHWRGRLFTGEFVNNGVTRWTTPNWPTDLTIFNWLKGNNQDVFFPHYMHVFRSLNPAPVVTLRPDASDVKYHWHDWSQPLFVPGADDPGLRWNLLHWQERRNDS